MAENSLNVTSGPDKPALLWAVSYPDRELVHFRADHDGIDARIDRMDEQSGGLSFVLYGTVQSGEMKGRAFRCTYSVESRSGVLTVIQA